MLRPFEIHQPTTVAEASLLLGKHGDEAKVYAGGTELLLAMKEGLLRYTHLVDVKAIPGLDEIGVDGGSERLSIGSGVTHRTLEQSAEVRARFPLVAEAEGKVANVRVRNVGTLGGNLCFAEPHSDPATFLLLYNAQVEVQGAGGTRIFPLADLTQSPYETCLEEDELLTRVLVPRFPDGMAGAYLKFGYHPRPTLGLGVAVHLDSIPVGSSNGRSVIEDVRIAVGAAGPKSSRVPEAEALLAGKTVAEVLGDSSRGETALLSDAGRLTEQIAEPFDDIHGTAEYKAHLVHVLLKRALRRAIDNAEVVNEA